MSNRKPRPKTMGDVLRLVEHDAALSDQARRETRCAIKRFLKIVSQPETMAANYPNVRRHIERVSPAMAGISKSRWANIRSLVGKTLERYAAPRRASLPGDLLPAWQETRGLLKERRFKLGLSGFIHWASDNGIEPNQVCDDVMADYRAYLHDCRLKGRPDRRFRDTCSLWNKAISQIDGWPQNPLTVPSFKKRVSRPWTDFPESFQKDVERYLQRMGEDEMHDDEDRPARSANTLKGHRYQIQRLASELVRSGYPIADVKDLSIIVEPDNARAALGQIRNRLREERKTDGQGGTSSRANPPCLGEIANTMIVIGRDHVGLEPERLKKLQNLRRNIKRNTPRRLSMTPKNLEVVRAIRDPRNKLRFLCLGDALVEQADKIEHPRRRALKIQTALMHEIELVAPLRLGNLAALNIERHLRFARPGRVGPVYLAVPGEEVKNKQPLEFELPERVVRLLLRYLNKERPHLLRGDDNGALFPGQRRRDHKGEVGISQQLTRAVRDYCGLKMTVHQYRHIAAFLYLQQHPTDFETVRRLLGHVGIDTTRKFYADVERLSASRAYNDAVLKQQRELSIRKKPRSPKKKGHKP